MLVKGILKPVRFSVPNANGDRPNANVDSVNSAEVLEQVGASPSRAWPAPSARITFRGPSPGSHREVNTRNCPPNVAGRRSASFARLWQNSRHRLRNSEWESARLRARVAPRAIACPPQQSGIAPAGLECEQRAPSFFARLH